MGQPRSRNAVRENARVASASERVYIVVSETTPPGVNQASSSFVFAATREAYTRPQDNRDETRSTPRLQHCSLLQWNEDNIDAAVGPRCRQPAAVLGRLAFVALAWRRGSLTVTNRHPAAARQREIQTLPPARRKGRRRWLLSGSRACGGGASAQPPRPPRPPRAAVVGNIRPRPPIDLSRAAGPPPLPPPLTAARRVTSRH